MMNYPDKTYRSPTVHELKCWPDYFGMVENGTKPFEVRRNDRRFQEDDVLLLREWNPDTREYTGRKCLRNITYILTGGQFGIEAGYVVLGLSTLTHEQLLDPAVAPIAPTMRP